MPKKRFKIVITDCDHPSIEIEKKILRNINSEPILESCKTEDDVIKVASDADAIINQYAPFTRKVIKSLKKCKIISRYGVGVDNIDLEAATECNIIVANVPDYCTDEVSTHALSLILSCARAITILDKKVRQKNWGFSLDKPLFRTEGQTLGILGLGRIARMVLQKASGFGFKTIAYDPYISKVESNVEMVSLKRLLSSSDFLTIHAPLTEETKHVIGEKELKMMKNTAYLINTSRGLLIDEKALHKALKERWIAGAALDVMEKEPPDWRNPLFSLENIIITPHISFYSEESYIELKTKAAAAVLSVLTGNKPISVVNKEIF
jgi:D-3-phosphoglycerate dehydrogenase